MSDSPRKEVKFVALPTTRIVMRGQLFIARACSNTMAKRIANALNQYQANEKGK